MSTLQHSTLSVLNRYADLQMLVLFQMQYSVAHLTEMTSAAQPRHPPNTREFIRKFSERGSAWLRLFRYVAKMAAVEYAKCTPLRTQRFGHFEYTYGSFQVHFFCRDHNRNTLRTQTKYTNYGNYGYRNTALV